MLREDLPIISLNGTAPSPIAQRIRRIALVGELHAIVLEVNEPNVRRDDLREVERRLGDWKGVAGIEHDPDVRAGLLAEPRRARGW